MEAFQSGTSQFVTDAEIYRRIDEAATGLYDMLISALGEDYFVTKTIVPHPDDQAYVALPRDFYRLVSVHEARRLPDLDAFGNDVYDFFDVEAFQRTDETALLNMRAAPQGPFKYRLAAERVRQKLTASTASTALSDVLELLPKRTVAGFVRLCYIPRLAQYDDPATGTADADDPLTDADPIYPGINGWEEHVVLSVAIRLLAKEESDTSDLRAERDRIEARILAARGKRDVGRPERVTNVRRSRLASVNRRGRWDDL